MKTIENLLKEYKIRFNVTDRIKEEGYPFAPLRINRGKAIPEVRGDYLCNEHGKVFGFDEWSKLFWATADVKEIPEKWVIEKDEENPLWKKFKEWFAFELKDSCLFINYKYIGNGSPCSAGNNLLRFEGHQYLTLEQWNELFFCKEEFFNGEIVYEDGRILIMKGNGRKNHVLYYPEGDGFHLNSSYGDGQDEFFFNFRPATEEEKQILFNRLKEAGKMWNPETLQIEDLGTIGNCAGCLVEIYMNRCGNFRNDKNMILCPLCYINYLVLKGMEMYFTDIEKLKQ